MSRLVLWLVVVVVLGFMPACRRGLTDEQASRPQHPLFKDLKQPPLNPPRSPMPVPDTATSPTISGARGIVILRQGRTFQGGASATGQVVISDGRIDFTGTNQLSLDIRYRLPKDMRPPAPYNGAADIEVLDESTAGGPDIQVTVHRGPALLFAAITRKSSEPNRVEIAPGTFVSQSPVDTTDSNRIGAAPLQIRDASGVTTTIPVGKNASVRAGGAVLNVFIAASYRVTRAPREQHEGGYVLEGWFVAQP